MTPPTITVVPVTPDHEILIRGWLDGDPDGQAHLGFFRDPTVWFALLSTHRRGWIAVRDDQPVGLLDLEVDGETGYFSYYVAPDLRRRGFGAAMLLELQSRCAELGLTRVVGYVEPTNTASLATLRRAGFTVADQPDDEGMLQVSRSLADR